MDPQQPTSVKKVLVKKVKVLVKRPVSVPQPGAPAPQPVMIKIPVKRPVQPQPSMIKVPVAQPIQRPVPTPQPAVQPVAQPQPAAVPAYSAASVIPQKPSGRKSFVGQIVNGVRVKPISFELPDDILDSIESKEKIPDKLFLLYIYARLYAQDVAEEEGYDFPDMMLDLPEDTLEAAQMIEEIDDDIFDALLDDFIEMAPFITGMERIMASKAPLDQIIQVELKRVQNQDSLTTAQQIILAYLMILADMQTVQHKLDLLDIKDEADDVVDEIKEIEEEEEDLKRSFIEAIERKRFPVDAKKLVSNYFTLAKKDPDKAYDTLITNPLFFSPIQLERLPKKFFGLIKPSPKDAMAVNRQLASFLKNLKA